MQPTACGKKAGSCRMGECEVSEAKNWKGQGLVNRGVMPPSTRVSLVGALRSILATRDVESDLTDVAGMSGCAFMVIVADGLARSGPTAFDWTVLKEGIQGLGLDTEIITVWYSDDLESADVPEDIAEELFERVRSEVDAGRCSALWGATDVPEFGVVYGYRNDSYLVRSYRSSAGGGDGVLGPDDAPEEPIQYLKLNAPGNLGAVFLGDRVEVLQDRVDHEILARAVQFLSGRHACFTPGMWPGYGAFVIWAEQLQAGNVDANGNAYTAECCWEMQGYAAEFCTRLAARNGRAAEALRQAGVMFTNAHDRLASFRKSFPLPGSGALPDEEAIKSGADLLRECGDLNRHALGLLESALGLL
jgi:hypothetical protein